MDYTLIRTNRKTLALQIDAQGQLIVRAPKRCPRRYIDDFVCSKEKWITEYQYRMLSVQNQREIYRPKNGDQLCFCGEIYRIIVIPGFKASLDMEQKTLTLPDLPMEKLAPLVRRLFQRAGLEWAVQRLAHWGSEMNIQYGKVNISSAVHRWGSCSANGNIHISYMLLMAPLEAIDYVMIHELAHRRHFNHSPEFWQLVARYAPDYQHSKQILRQLQERLYSQGWCEG